MGHFSSGDEIMQMKILMTLVAALAVMGILAAAALPAASQNTDTMSASDMANMANMMMPRAVMMTISAGSMSGGNVTYSVPYGAKVYQMDDKAIGAVATYNKPLMGMCNVTTGIGMISFDNALPATATIDYANNTAIPVAGANAVVALQDFKMLGAGKGKGDYDFQFGTVTVYLPDGTAKTMKLDKPVKMSMSMDKMKLMITGNPTMANMMAGLLKSGATFPAGATPVKVSDILATK
jgi:hypothetical protein